MSVHMTICIITIMNTYMDTDTSTALYILSCVLVLCIIMYLARWGKYTFFLFLSRLLFLLLQAVKGGGGGACIVG